MTIFLVNWLRPGLRDLHELHLKRELLKDDRFKTAAFRVADAREPGPYRVVGVTHTDWVIEDPGYSSTRARLEVGFTNAGSRYWYWFNWLEPERSFLFGWHRDGHHEDLGPVHAQVHQGESVIDRRVATPITGHPGAIFHRRLEQLPEALLSLEWIDDTVIGFPD